MRTKKTQENAEEILVRAASRWATGLGCCQVECPLCATRPPRSGPVTGPRLLRPSWSVAEMAGDEKATSGTGSSRGLWQH